MRTILILLTSATLSMAQQQPTKDWKAYTDPSEAGFSTQKLAKAQFYYDSIGFGATLIIHNGAVLASWGENTRRFMLASMRKSLLSALIGQAIDQKKLTLESTLAELGIDDKTPLTDSEKSAKLKDLLTTRSGVYLPSAFEFQGWKELKPDRGSHEPGTFWYYNNWDFNALCTIYEQATDQKLFESFHNRIADQIGMQDFRSSDGIYYYEPESMHPAYLFKMSSRDLARFGLLYLNKGDWGGHEILPASWIELSTRAHAQAYNDSYGYLWWTNSVLDFPAYSAKGAGRHTLTVIPELDLVIVIRANDYTGRPIKGRENEMLEELIVEAKTGIGAEQPSLEPITWFEKRNPSAKTNVHKINPIIPGDYQHPQFGNLTIELNNSQLTLLGKPARFNLIPIGENQYFIEDIAIEAIFEVAPDTNTKNTSQMAVKPGSRERVLMFYY